MSWFKVSVIIVCPFSFAVVGRYAHAVFFNGSPGKKKQKIPTVKVLFLMHEPPPTLLRGLHVFGGTRVGDASVPLRVRLTFGDPASTSSLAVI